MVVVLQNFNVALVNLASHSGKGAVEVMRDMYRTEGLAVFFRGLGVCSLRAFIVNAVTWLVYERMMEVLHRPSTV